MIEAARRRLLPVDDGVGSAAVAVLLVVLVVASAGSDVPGSDRAFDLGAVALLGLAAGFALLARPAPATGAVATLAITMAWYQLGYTSSLVNVPYLVAFYLLGTSGDRRRQLVVGALAVGATAVSILGADDGSTASAASAIGWTLTALLLGELTHNRRALLDALEVRAAVAESERDLEAHRRVALARLEIARDLHDVLAHTVSVMTVQAGVGHDALRRGTGEAEAAFVTIKAAGREATAEVQALVAVLRDGAGPPGTTPAPRLDRVAGLASATRALGIDVDARVDVPDGRVPDLVQVTAYRIVQESLTNVVRHAHARRADVAVRAEGDDIVVEVGDDGRGSPTDVEPGFGLRGMRERVESLGGTVVAGPGPGGGWRVHARIPRDRGRVG